MRSHDAFRAITAAILALMCAACMAQGPQVQLKGKWFSVELAETQDKQALGLMFRDSLPKRQGMLFIFPAESMRSFWMKNTRIPLDIFYFDDDLKLVNVIQGAMPCRAASCPGYPSTGPARYVLELNAGLAAELGVEPGDELRLDL